MRRVFCLTNIRGARYNESMEEVVILLMVVGGAVSSFFIHLCGLQQANIKFFRLYYYLRIYRVEK